MIIKHGTTRIVFLIGRWACKVPSIVEWRLFLLGLLSNMQEVVFSTVGCPKLCPVRFHLPGGFLVVMPRAEPVTREWFSHFKYDEFILWDCKDHPAGCMFLPVEEKLDSFGVLDGHIVAIDYGS